MLSDINKVVPRQTEAKSCEVPIKKSAAEAKKDGFAETLQKEKLQMGKKEVKTGKGKETKPYASRNKKMKGQPENLDKANNEADKEELAKTSIKKVTTDFTVALVAAPIILSNNVFAENYTGLDEVINTPALIESSLRCSAPELINKEPSLMTLLTDEYTAENVNDLIQQDLKTAPDLNQELGDINNGIDKMFWQLSKDAQSQKQFNLNYLKAPKFPSLEDSLLTAEANLINKPTVSQHSLTTLVEQSLSDSGAVINPIEKGAADKIVTAEKLVDLSMETSLKSEEPVNDLRTWSNLSNIATEPELPEPQKIMEQIVKQIELMPKKNNSTLRINLKPEYLGKLTIHLSWEAGSIIAKFTTESHNVKNLLEANMQNLKQTLENNGIKVEKTEVNVQLDNNSAFNQSDFANSRQGAQQGWGNKFFHDYQAHPYNEDENVIAAYNDSRAPIKTERELSFTANAMNFLV